MSEHIPLVDLLPLSGPLSVLVDPSSTCNLRCNYCPTGHPELSAARVGRGLMRSEVFRKIVEDLGRFPRRPNTLHLYKDGEPLLNPSLAWMVATAVDRGVAASVETTTNGLLLTREKAIALIDAGLDRIRISIQPSSTGARQDAKAAHVYERCLTNVVALREERDRRGSALEIHVKSIDFGRDDPLLLRLSSDFGALADSIHLDTAMGWTGAAAFDFTLGSAPASNMTGQVALRPSRIVCPQPFYSMAINFDGAVSACCVDWSRDVVVGDVREQSLSEIWDGDALRHLRLLHLDGRRGENPACRSCQYVQGASEEADVDGHRRSLRRLYDS